MNILISTTTNWNPGDDFIRYGVKNLLNSLYSDINYVHYDRNPDYFKSDNWEMGSNHKSNVMNDPIDWFTIDAVVLAGSPEFLHGPLKPLYEGLYNNPHIPLLALGVGYSNDIDMLAITHIEHQVLSRSSTLIITRQYDLQKKLKELLHGKKVHCLPCPAIFAAPDRRGRQSPKTLAIPQTSYGPQGIDTKDSEVLFKELEGEERDLLFQYVEDFKLYQKGFFSSDARELLDKIIQYKYVISNRLHSGIAGLSAGSIVKFINSSNRVQKALEPYAKYSKEGLYYMSLYQINQIAEQYTNLIRNILTLVI